MGVGARDSGLVTRPGRTALQSASHGAPESAIPAQAGGAFQQPDGWSPSANPVRSTQNHRAEPVIRCHTLPCCHPGAGRRCFTTAEWRVIQWENCAKHTKTVPSAAHRIRLDPGLRRDDKWAPCHGPASSLRRDDCVCLFAPFACFADSRSIAGGAAAREWGVGSRESGVGSRESGDSIFQGARQRHGKPKGRRTKNSRHPGAARSAEPGIRFDYTQFTGKQPLPQRQWIPDRGCAASGMTGHLAGKPCARAARAGRLLLKRDARESPERAARPASNSRHRSPCAGRS